MTPPSPSLFLLDPFVSTYLPGDDTANNQRHVLSSGAKQAFGFPADMDCDTIMRRLELEADLAGAPDLCCLTLRGGRPMGTCIYTVDKNLIIIATSFPGVYYRDVLLIYDAIDRSLHMIPSAPSSRPFVRAARALVARRRDDDRSYALVSPGSVYGKGPKRESVLFVSPSSSNLQWEIVKYANFPDHLLADRSSFFATEVFSHRGRGYWVDLLFGGMYCDCGDLLSGDGGSVDVLSLDLPVGWERFLGCRRGIPEPRAFRAVGCVGDSVKFVSITGFLERVDLVDDRMVRVWTLREDMSWDVDYELKLGSLREEKGEFKGNDLPTSMAPMYPFLNMQEDRVIYFALGDYTQGLTICFPSEPPRFWVRVDMSSKTFNCTPLSLTDASIGDLHCTPLSLTDASIGDLLAISGNAEGKLAWTSSQEEVANF